MAKIYLLRHGQVSGDAALYGHTDVGVATDVNQSIVAGLSRQLVKIDAIYCSPLQRCAKLASLLGQHYQCDVSQLAQLKEMNFGIYDGVAFDELYRQPEKWQALTDFWQNPVQHTLPKAELLTGFSFRVKQAWQQIIAQQSADQYQQDLLVVCHGGVIRMILAHLLNVDYRNPDWYTQLSIANGSVTTISVTAKKLVVNAIAKPLASDLFDAGDDFNDHHTLLNQAKVTLI